MPDAPTPIPLWAPLYRATFTEAFSRFWKKYATFEGRASHREYWWSVLFLSAGYIVSLTLLYTGLGIWNATSGNTGAPPVIFPIGLILTVVWFFATIVPWLALEARRLHDANKSGYLLFIHLASWPGAIAVFILCQLAPNPLGRRFDAPPGEPPRFARLGYWPPAPGEPDVAYEVGFYGVERPVTAPPPPPAPPVDR